MELKEKLDNTLEDYIKSMAWIKSDAKILEYKKAGDGNMNFVVRVTTSLGNIILKQSFPYVKKYPQISAPIARIEIEKIYYDKLASDPFLLKFSPRIIGFDESSHIIAMEDLGYASDFIGIYQKPSKLTHKKVEVLTNYLLHLHNLSIEDFPANSEMKYLNHEHIFNFPFLEENGFDLDNIQNQLQSVAIIYKKDEKLKAKIKILGDRYLAKGESLLHGDFYPASWLDINENLKVIDPEFAFIGDKEFDLGVMLAHLQMANVNPKLIELAFNNYTKNKKCSSELINQYTGIEILRRLIGIAQLPLVLSVKEKQEKLILARKLIMEN